MSEAAEVIDSGGDEPPNPAPAPHAPGAGGLKAKILVVDDDERNAFAATSALEDLGQEIVVARSGEEALRKLLQDDFAVILLDVHMPGMDGYETATLIRQRRRTSRIPIVFLTAVFRDEAHLFQAYSAGAVDVVFKPLDPFILRSKVQVLVDLHLKTVAVQQQAERSARLLAENIRVQREKQLAELALRRSEERQAAILRSLPIVFHARSAAPPYQPLFLSNNVETLTGCAAERFLETAEFALGRIHPDDLQAVVDALSGAGERGFYSCEFRWLCADGQYRRFLDQGVPAPAEGDGPGEIVGALLDVTDRKLLEEQLAQARKMEAVGQLTGGVAHDFNNLLTVIIGNLDLIERRGDLDDKLKRGVSAMRYAADRGRSLTRQLLAFSRRQHLMPVTLDINRLIREFAPLLQQAVGEAVSLHLDLEAHEVCAEVDSAQLETALLNLAVNARDAMPQGGGLTIATRRVEAAAAGGPRAEGADEWVCIEVRDTGVGIPADALERIFEPFFTTKDVGKGSGLGLSQVYGFVQQSGGRITVESEPGRGARFQLFLKRSEKAPDAPEPAREASAAAEEPGHGRVLVVEDDQQVLTVTVEMLQGLGYDVVTASDAEAALRRLEEHADFDLLFSDVIMPGGRNGVELAKLARDLRPQLKVLLTSGYVGEANLLAGDAFELIDKPYERSTLAAKLQELLGDRAPPRRPGGRSGRGGRNLARAS